MYHLKTFISNDFDIICTKYKPFCGFLHSRNNFFQVIILSTKNQRISSTCIFEFQGFTHHRYSKEYEPRTSDHYPIQNISELCQRTKNQEGQLNCSNSAGTFASHCRLPEGYIMLKNPLFSFVYRTKNHTIFHRPHCLVLIFTNYSRISKFTVFNVEFIEVQNYIIIKNTRVLCHINF